LPNVTILRAKEVAGSVLFVGTKYLNTPLDRLLVTIRRANGKKCHSLRWHGLPGLCTSGKFFGVVELIHSAFRGSGWAALALSDCLALGATASIFFLRSGRAPTFQKTVLDAELIANSANDEIDSVG
jgi:hypothetical protein